MKNNQNNNSLSLPEIEKISSSHIHGVDKWYRMYAGIASKLERYEYGILYLRVDNTEKQLPSNYDTALKFAECWRKWNKELKSPRGFVVSFYKTQSTGFVMSFDGVENKDVENKKEAIEKLITELRKTPDEPIFPREEKKELIGIFSGLFTACLNEEL